MRRPSLVQVDRGVAGGRAEVRWEGRSDMCCEFGIHSSDWAKSGATSAMIRKEVGLGCPRTRPKPTSSRKIALVTPTFFRIRALGAHFGADSWASLGTLSRFQAQNRVDLQIVPKMWGPFFRPSFGGTSPDLATQTFPRQGPRTSPRSEAQPEARSSTRCTRGRTTCSTSSRMAMPRSRQALNAPKQQRKRLKTFAGRAHARRLLDQRPWVFFHAMRAPLKRANMIETGSTSPPEYCEALL